MQQSKSSKRILIIRTDRMGDVVLSTPVVKAIRKVNPEGFIAMMVTPYTSELVEGNPYLNKVIIFDKYGKDGRILGTLRFAMGLRRYSFDIAIILHTTRRVNLIVFLAGIPERIGYDKKSGLLLTKGVKSKKHLGEKHEVDYNLDLLKEIGIHSEDRQILIPLKEENSLRIETLLRERGIAQDDTLIAVHPFASCPSKLWPLMRFSSVIEELAEEFRARVLIISGPENIEAVEGLAKSSNAEVITVPLGQLAFLLRRAAVLISCDSGPVHIASAVGTPVVAIFGRNEPGLSPRRWGPLGDNNIILHKDVDCTECLAHNCKRGFKCIKAITQEEVMGAVREVIKK